MFVVDTKFFFNSIIFSPFMGSFLSGYSVVGVVRSGSKEVKINIISVV